MTKRVALLVPSMVAGGAERCAIHLGTVLEEAGYEVDLVVAVSKGVLLEDEWARAHLVELKAVNELLCLGGWLRYLRRAKPDLAISLVHSANFISGIGTWCGNGVPVILGVHNTLLKEPRDQWWIRRWFGHGLERRLYRRVRLVQTVSEALAEQAERLWDFPRDRIVVSYNSAELADDEAAPTDPEVTRRIAQLQPFLLSAGRLAVIKGFDTLIGDFAAARVPDDLKLVIIGEGPERPVIEAQIERHSIGDRVILAGFQQPVEPWYRAAKGFVFATRGEGLPLVIQEALRAGLPIAASRVPGVTEMLGHGSVGRLVAPDDRTGMVAAIEDIASGDLGPPDPQVLGAHLSQFTPEAVGERYLEMVERVIGPA